MKQPAESPANPRNRIAHVALLVFLLCLIPKIASSGDVADGMRIGNQFITNSLGSTSSVMIGAYNSGAGPFTLAVGSSNYIGANYNGFGSIAVGSSNYLMGYNNFAFGGSNNVSGSHSMALGHSNFGHAPYSFTYGLGNQVPSSANSALAGGSYNIAEAYNAVALGYKTTAKTYASVVIGQYNKMATSENDSLAKTQWRSADPLFVVGNGTGTATENRANALVIKKDGTIIIKRQGDIPMTGFEAP